MTQDSVSSSDSSYDNAIVAIAIGDDMDMDMDAHGDDDGFNDIVNGITAAIDDTDVDQEETWLRKCTGEIPDGIETKTNGFGKLPPEIQMKLVLDLREKEKATLLGNLRECSSVVERLKAQLYESEDRRIELEEELDTENTQIKAMKREFNEMKKAHNSRVKDLERITKEMLIQRERLAKIFDEQEHRQSDSNSVPSKIEPILIRTNMSPMREGGCDGESNTIISPTTSKVDDSDDTCRMKIEFERKLKDNPKYREEFERFKEFQAYYQATRDEPHQTNRNDNSNNKDVSIPLPFGGEGEEYRKMKEFQVGYEEILSFQTKKDSKRIFCHIIKRYNLPDWFTISIQHCKTEIIRESFF